jgi:hypothetical protein
MFDTVFGIPLKQKCNVIVTHLQGNRSVKGWDFALVLAYFEQNPIICRRGRAK